MSGPTLHVRGLSRRFGAVVAVEEVSFDLGPGEVVGLIGPNGAGKSTVVNCLSGVLRPSAGDVRLDDTAIGRWPAHRIVRAGLARTFQHPRGFATMSVEENLSVATHTNAAARGQDSRDGQIRQAASSAGLLAHLDQPVHALSLSNRRRLEIARVLATGARLVLLDEVMAGLSEQDIEGLIPLIERLVAGGVGVLLVEHLVWVVSRLSTRLVVLDHGRELAAGEPKAVLNDPTVVEAYLGQAIA